MFAANHENAPRARELNPKPTSLKIDVVPFGPPGGGGVYLNSREDCTVCRTEMFSKKGYNYRTITILELLLE